MVRISPAANLQSPTTTASAPTSTAAAPTTAGMPQPRATTAAWLASPPREVSTPAAHAMAGTSSGEVSSRTSRHLRPAASSAAAPPVDVTISPQASPGEAGSPDAIGAWPAGRPIQTSGGRRSSAATRRTASTRESGNAGFSAMSSAMRSAAGALALAGTHLEQPEPSPLDGELDVTQVR